MATTSIEESLGGSEEQAPYAPEAVDPHADAAEGDAHAGARVRERWGGHAVAVEKDATVACGACVRSETSVVAFFFFLVKTFRRVKL